jgi:hypothetical protein
LDGKRQAAEPMKFRKELKFVVEGEVHDQSIPPEEILKSLKFSWKHWWEGNPNWPYGKPSEALQAGRIDKIIFEGVELK